MKKRIFAAMSAAVLGACAFCMPASATTYQLGDVDMDGEVSAVDAYLAIAYYVCRLAGYDNIHYTVSVGARTKDGENVKYTNLPPLTDEQVELANVCKDEWTICPDGSICPVTARDAQCILNYYTTHLAQHDDVTMEDIVSGNWRR